MSAAASAYATIIWGTKEANTGRTSGPGSARTNTGTSTGRRWAGYAVFRARAAADRPSVPGTAGANRGSKRLEALEVGAMRPVGRSHLWQLDAAATRSVDVEQCRPRQEPADGSISRGQRFHARDDAVDEIDETLAVGDIPGTIDEPVMSGDQAGELEGSTDAEIPLVEAE